MPLGKLSFPVSKSASTDTIFSTACGFVGLLDYDLVLGSCVVSLQSPKLQLGWITSIVITSSLDAVLVMVQTMCSVAHPSRSFWLHKSYPSVSDLAPRGFSWNPCDFLKPNNRLCF